MASPFASPELLMSSSGKARTSLTATLATSDVSAGIGIFPTDSVTSFALTAVPSALTPTSASGAGGASGGSDDALSGFVGSSVDAVELSSTSTGDGAWSSVWPIRSGGGVARVAID